MICIRSPSREKKENLFFFYQNYVEKFAYPHPYFSYSTYDQKEPFEKKIPFLHNSVFLFRNPQN